MIKRRKLGQHFLISTTIAKKIVSTANITKKDIVLEVGTGTGILTPLLCQKAKKVISIDVDKTLVKNAQKIFSELKNLDLQMGDGFKKKNSFTIFVSNLPYSKSKEAIEWLSQRSFSCGVIMVQKEFAEKLLSKKPQNRKSISIIANHAFDIKEISRVGKNNFSPPPKVDSVILKITQKKVLNKDLIQTINKIFSYRRKKVKNILKQFKNDSQIDKRIDELSGDEIVDLANQILKK